MDPSADRSFADKPAVDRPFGDEPAADRHPAGKPAPLPDWVHDQVPLERPLAVFDLETTGTMPQKDRIVEIAILKIEPEGRRETLCHRVNPEMPIPREATAIHGITDADVAAEPTFRQLAPGLAEFLTSCDLAGFNLIRFDLPLLRHEFERASIPFRMAGRRLVDALTIFHHKEPRNLAAAHRFYCGEEFDEAHSAAADVRATYRVLLGQLRRYGDLPHSMDDLHRFCNPIEAVDVDRRFVWQGDEVLFAFGKYRGQPLRSIVTADRGYLEWIANESELPAEARRIARDALQGVFPLRLTSKSPGRPEASDPSPRQERLPFPRSSDEGAGGERSAQPSGGTETSEGPATDRRDERNSS